MAIYTVDTKADIVDAGDGVLSLREALALADADRATADTIVFAPAVQGRTIVLAGSQLTVNSDVTIDGGSGVTIDAHEKSRVLLVQGDRDGRDARAPDHHRRPNDGRSDAVSDATRWRHRAHRRAIAQRIWRSDADQQHGQRQQHPWRESFSRRRGWGKSLVLAP